MPDFNFKFYFNSAAFVMSDGRPIARKIGYSRDPQWDGYAPGDELTLAWEGKIAVDISPEGLEERFRLALKAIWALFNAPWQRPAEYAGPSLSIGDVVVLLPDTLQEAAFSVERIGFKRVNVAESEKKLTPGHWFRTEQQTIEYLKEKQADGAELTPSEKQYLGEEI